MTPQCGRSVVQVLLVRVDIRVVTYEAMTPQCGRSLVQILLVRVDIGVVTYEAMTPSVGGHDCQSGYIEVVMYDTQCESLLVLEVVVRLD